MDIVHAAVGVVVVPVAGALVRVVPEVRRVVGVLEVEPGVAVGDGDPQPSTRRQADVLPPGTSASCDGEKHARYDRDDDESPHSRTPSVATRRCMEVG